MSASLNHKCFLCFLFLVLWGCAPNHEFHAIPQDGAQHSNSFPRFSDRPEAETSQLAPQTSQNLAHELRQQGQDLQRQARVRPRKIKRPDEQTQDLQEEIAQTLRQIEQGDPPPTQP